MLKKRRDPEKLQFMCCASFVVALEKTCLRTAGDLVYREKLRSWVSTHVPWLLRQELLSVALRGGRLYNAVDLLLLELLLDSDVRELVLRQVRPFYWTSFLSIVARYGGGLETLSLEDSGGTPGPILGPTLSSLQHLQYLTLRFVADDTCLATLGYNCHHLQSLDVSSSLSVTDSGLRLLCLWTPPPPDHNTLDNTELQHNCWGVKQGESIKKESCFDLVNVCLQPLINNAIGEADGQSWKRRPSWWRQSLLKRAKKNPCCSSLLKINLNATQVTCGGLHIISACVPSAVVLTTIKSRHL